MKKLRSILILLFAAGIILPYTACVPTDDDDDIVSNGPILTIVTDFSGKTVQAWRGETFNFDVTAAENATSKRALVDMSLSVVGPGADWDTIYTIDASSFTMKYSYTVSNDVQDGNSITITFKLTDKAGEITERIYNLNIVDPADVLTWTDVELGAQGSNIGSAYSTEFGTVYTISNDEAKANQEKVDFIYVYHEKGTDQKTAVLASPDDDYIWGDNNSYQINYGIHLWTIKNATRFRNIFGSLTRTEFDNLTSLQLADKYNNSSATVQKMAPYLLDAPPSMYAFKTADERYGVIWVTKLKAANGNLREGSLVFDVKVQKP